MMGTRIWTMSIQDARVGDKVVYAKEKNSFSPGPRAQEVSAASKGDTYSYIVEKYWVVKKVNGDGTLVLLTRKGKEHCVNSSDLRLRRANLWEKLFLNSRFPKLDD